MYVILYTYKVYTFKKCILTLRETKETSSIVTTQETLEMDVNTS